ncbi:type VI secretion system-associated FHA domain protein TagH [Pseudomonas chlororaphis]|uniref:type VI secretion system-associated FHA domain protein TagH n=1 Tax=Pseudomonas chlororaphis TaxID=587753 RepID=UPI0004722CC0|nr:type VI secretion system-associated FHA domain protein TagH [Pseudomonas chlororaphis]
MNTALPEPRLFLVVENPEVLQQGSIPRHIFDTSGGIIGSQGASWDLHDRGGSVHARHCEIRFEDGGYLVIDRCGQTSVNEQTRPLGINASARLRNADTLHVGQYRISVHLDDELHQLPDPGRMLAEHDLGEFLSLPSDYLDGLPAAAPDDSHASTPQQPGWAEFQALAEPPPPHGLLDPLKALDAARGRSGLLDDTTAGLDPRHYGHTPLAAQADVTTTQFEAVYGSPMHAPGEPRMLEQDIQTPAARAWLQSQLANSNDPAGMVAPLVEGIGAPVGTVDGQEAYALLHEAGRTLGAIIRGLSALNASHPGGQQRISLAGRTLQPIEDNPLRLDQSYPDTVRALFSAERSVVHLSPAAAVEESLEQIQRQQVAMHKAITAGLGALLQAFSPEQLQQRFQRYQSAQAGQPHADDWAWRMYGHYYTELTSGRQQGFEKLFWEVFEQVFDQALRTEA